MKLSKFPVTSKNGIEYHVKIQSVMDDCFAVGIYLQVPGIFGIKYLKLVNPGILGGVPWLTGEKYDYDFIKMAKYEIEKLENEVQAQITKDNLISINTAEFNAWDGEL